MTKGEKVEMCYVEGREWVEYVVVVLTKEKGNLQ